MATPKFPDDLQSDTETVIEELSKRRARRQPESSELRDEILSLAERGEIKYTVNKV